MSDAAPLRVSGCVTIVPETMPIYEYLCDGCDARVELFQRQRRTDARTRPACPHCGARRLRRQFSAFGVRSEAPWAGFDDTGMNDVDADDPEALAALSDALPGGLNDT